MDAAWKTEFFCLRYFSKRKSKPAEKIQGDVFLFKPRAKIQALLRKKEKTQNRHLAPFSLHPFNCFLRVRDKKSFGHSREAMSMQNLIIQNLEECAAKFQICIVFQSHCLYL